MAQNRVLPSGCHNWEQDLGRPTPGPPFATERPCLAPGVSSWARGEGCSLKPPIGLEPPDSSSAIPALSPLSPPLPPSNSSSSTPCREPGSPGPDPVWAPSSRLGLSLPLIKQPGTLAYSSHSRQAGRRAAFELGVMKTINNFKDPKEARSPASHGRPVYPLRLPGVGRDVV